MHVVGVSCLQLLHVSSTILDISAKFVCLSALGSKVVLSLFSIFRDLQTYVTTGWEKEGKIALIQSLGECEPVMTYVIVNMTYVIFI